jgi:hypothetical protein
MLEQTLQPRLWEMELPAPTPATAGAAAGGDNSQLTKNQKKKAKRRAKKGSESGSQQVTGSVLSEPDVSGRDATGKADAGDDADSKAAAVAAAAQQQQQNGAAAANGLSEQQHTASEAAPGSPGSGADVVPPSPPSAAPLQPSPQQELLVYESRVLNTPSELLTARAVVVDFGNACWTHKHFTDDIQVRVVWWCCEGGTGGGGFAIVSAKPHSSWMHVGPMSVKATGSNPTPSLSHSSGCVRPAAVWPQRAILRHTCHP